MIHVSLSKTAQANCRRWATQRGGNPRPSTRQFSKDYNLIGILAEESFGLLIGMPGPRFNPNWRDPGWDFDTPIGKVDTKGSNVPGGSLFVKHPEGEDLKADYYVLVYVTLDPCSAYVFGYATPKEVLAVKPRIFKNDDTPAHVLAPTLLHDASPLVAEINAAKEAL